MPQAQQAAASLGVPQLANVFYYGKDFTSKKQKLTKQGTVVEERYRPLSVTKAGAIGEMLEEQEIAAREKSKENDDDDIVQQLLAQSEESGPSLDDLLNIIGKG
jgi:predicted nuclease of restriction endonuclease-like (RecB) superfamily